MQESQRVIQAIIDNVEKVILGKTEQIKMVLNRERPTKSLAHELGVNIERIANLRYKWGVKYSYLIDKSKTKKKRTVPWKANPGAQQAEQYPVPTEPNE